MPRLEGLGDQAGGDRDAYVQDALRRYLAGRDRVALQRKVSSRSGVAFDDALDFVYSERNAARAELASVGHGLATSVTRAVVDVTVLVSAGQWPTSSTEWGWRWLAGTPFEQEPVRAHRRADPQSHPTWSETRPPTSAGNI